jgi:hypothetical protein
VACGSIVEPGVFLTDLLVVGDSALWAEVSIDDHAKQTAELVPGRQSMNGKQSGDAAELAHAVVELIDWPTPPQRFVAGTDGVDSVAQKGHALLDQVEAYRWLSTSLETLDFALLGEHRSRPSS